MRTSKYLLFTMKEIPAQTEIISHKLMLRSGMIKKISSGLYTWLPNGLRVLKKIENIVREEMNNIGAIEICMPITQPIELWYESGRYKQYNQQLLNFTDRNNHNFVLSPTNEEIITDLIRKILNTYKQLPISLFQIQTKFRDEIRPRFGVIRCREFLMKDAYSLHTSQKSLQETYNKMYETYIKIFKKINLDFVIVKANNGSIGGNVSHEFQVISKNGEDNIIVSDSSNYAANIEVAESLAPTPSHEVKKENIRLIDTSYFRDISDLIKHFNISIKKIVRTILVKAAKGNNFPLVALLIRGDHDLNKIKLEKLPQIAIPLTFASKKEIYSIIGSDPEYLGPINMPIPLIIDRNVAVMNNFIVGANINGKHYFGVNWNRDIAIQTIADIRNVVTGDPSPDGKGILKIKHGIEVGHIFQLGSKYSRAMNAVVKGKDGKNQVIIMGCYGIGLTRVVAAIIEQNHDRFGIIWPSKIAPFQVAILPINMHKSFHVEKQANELYNILCDLGIDTLIDDRNKSPGIMFKDIELIGVPHIIIISDYNINHGFVEYKNRRSGEKKIIKIHEIKDFVMKLLKEKD